MFKNMEITGIHSETDDKLAKYIRKTIGKLERYLPRHARKSAQVQVRVKENKKQRSDQCTAEVIIRLPHETLNAKESTINMYAAVDIVQAKMQNQLRKYKDTHANPKLYRRLTNRFRRRNPNEL